MAERINPRLLPALALLLLSACSSPSRPPWADGAIVRTPRDPDAPPPSFKNFAARLLALHNRERARLGIQPLVGDARLAADAARYGAQMAARGKFEHSAPATRPGQGENLWTGTHGAFTLEEMVDGWIEEKRLFRPGIFPDVSDSGKWSDVAHYTQMIWRGSTNVGCALHQGPERDYLVCRYTPAGNVVGQKIP